MQYFVVAMFQRDITNSFLFNFVQFFCFINQTKNVYIKYLFFERALLKKTTSTTLLIKIQHKSPERQTEQSQSLIMHFQILKALPSTLSCSQCVSHKHEILICGGKDKRACYSYNTIKNEYKFICEYPSDVKLSGHCVVKLVDNNSKDRNGITLLSFGGSNKHTLVMKYVSVWSNISDKSNKLNSYNQWVPFTDKYNHPIIIGSDDGSYEGVRAVIGGINNHLLFITYYYNNISVFDLNTFQFIKHDKLPTDNWIKYHCF
ncbi:hypothetical protein RFI_25138, partial [Reticulomyxa filosa]